MQGHMEPVKVLSEQEDHSACEGMAGAETPDGASPTSPFDFTDHLSTAMNSTAYKSSTLAGALARAEESSSWCLTSLKTIASCSEMLGHALDDRAGIAAQQQPDLASYIQSKSTVQLRHASQRPLFTVAPLDVLVTRDQETGRNTFHIIEINGTGIAGLSNMPDHVIGTVMRSLSEITKQFAGEPSPLILVASSGQESTPPVSRTMHEKCLYIEALKRGFEALGRPVHITNMNRLEENPASMPRNGPTLCLGYMKQFRQHFHLGSEGQLTLFGRRVTAAVNDRFILNILYQFNHKVDLRGFTGFNAGFTAGADKGVAYTLYNSFFSPQGRNAASDYPSMAPLINFARAHTRDELVTEVQRWLGKAHRPVVIKPQGTGCGHGLEFFFGPEPRKAVESKVDASIATVARNYALECGGLPYTVCEYLNTAAISDVNAKRHDGQCTESASPPHPMAGHKFELRIVVYRDGDVLKAYPSIAKVARDAFDPDNPDKSQLINNITTSVKQTGQDSTEFMLPLSNARTLQLLGIRPEELCDLCAASTAFVRYVVDQVQDTPQLFGLPTRTQ